MDKNVLKAVIITCIILVIAIFVGLFLLGYLRQRPGGITVFSSTDAEVYVDGVSVGKTPYDGTTNKKIVEVRISPTDTQLDSYKEDVSVIPDHKSIVSRDFDPEKNISYGYTAYFEKINKDESGLNLTSNPDSAQIYIDNLPKGFAPYKQNRISVSEHKIEFKTEGYEPLSLTSKVLKGYALNINAVLKPNVEEVKAVESETKTYILIHDTPTGYLRVRSAPGTDGEEIHQVSPGEKYLFLDEDPDTGWYKIQLQPPAPGLPEGLVGWVSNDYSEKIEETIDARDLDTSN